MHIISEIVPMLSNQNYRNQSMLVETTACQSWLVFWRHNVVGAMDQCHRSVSLHRPTL